MNKKSLCVLLLSAVCATGAIAQDKNTVRFDVKYKRVTTTRGELYQYSERYLGISDVIKEDEVSYRLTDIRMHGADSQSTAEDKSAKTNKKTPLNSPSATRAALCLPAPLSEDVLMATNTAKKAEGVAKQIYRLREARISLVSGEAEHAPADGTAMQLSLQELKSMEKDLTELFVGTTQTRTELKKVHYDLGGSMEEETEVVLLRFSKHDGPVEADDLSGEPVYMKITRTIGEKQTEDKKKKKNAEPQMEVKEVRIEVEYDGKVMLRQTL